MINNFMNCCFIGHSTIYDMDIVKEWLKHIVQELIQRGVTTFYNGGMGQFDALGARTVYDLKKTYGHIKNVLITPYPNVDEYAARLFDEVIYPNLEKYPRKYAIIYRNRFMVDNSDNAIAYVIHGWGGAAQTLEYAMKKGLHIINATDNQYYK